MPVAWQIVAGRQWLFKRLDKASARRVEKLPCATQTSPRSTDVNMSQTTREFVEAVLFPWQRTGQVALRAAKADDEDEEDEEEEEDEPADDDEDADLIEEPAPPLEDIEQVDDFEDDDFDDEFDDDFEEEFEEGDDEEPSASASSGPGQDAVEFDG
jgi:hypothetical protein